MNELMFRLGVFAAIKYDDDQLKPLLDPDIQVHQHFVGHYQSPCEVFKSDWAFYLTAIVVEMLSIVLVASTFWGYWKLGRNVSLSPLETAKVELSIASRKFSLTCAP